MKANRFFVAFGLACASLLAHAEIVVIANGVRAGRTTALTALTAQRSTNLATATAVGAPS